MQQKIKGKKLRCLLLRRKKKLLFYIYAVIVKQFFYKRSSNYYWWVLRGTLIVSDVCGGSAHAIIVAHDSS
jgi:hypothetical protein